MHDEQLTQEITKSATQKIQEESFRALLYQFMELYERWEADREIITKQGADIAQLVSVFTEQVQRFQELEPQVKKQIIASIQNSTTKAVEIISERIGQEATREVEDITRKLKDEVWQAQRLLNDYQQEVINSQWKTILIAACTTVATCFLVVWLLMPKATLPLTTKQIDDLNNGQIIRLIWPTLSKEEKEHLNKLAQAKHRIQIKSAEIE